MLSCSGLSPFDPMLSALVRGVSRVPCGNYGRGESGLPTGTPLVFGTSGARTLRTGEMSGDDPLRPYGDVALRVWQ